MKQDLTELVFILDKSGSMSGLESDTIGGYNSLLEKQKKEEGEAVVTTVLFSDNSSVIHDRVNITDVNKLTDKEYFVSGCTALLDSVGETIQHIVSVHNGLPEEERPCKTLFVITTDGMENASREYTYDAVKKLIEKQKELGWEFIFLGANIDTVKVSERFGIDRKNAVSYNCDREGIDLNYACLSKAVSSMRRKRSVDSSWREKIDKDFSDRKGK